MNHHGAAGRRARSALVVIFLVAMVAEHGGAIAQAKEYRHPGGLGFTYPSSWTAAEQGGVLVLTPPRVAKNAQGQAVEAYLVGMQPAPGMASPTDPQVIAYLDQTARSMSAYLVRQGGPTLVGMPKGRGFATDQAIRLDYEARGADGQIVRARIYACLIAGQGIAIIGFGLGKHVLGRDRQMLAMLKSINVKGGTAAAGRAAGEVGNQTWGFFFRPPSGWTHRANADGAILGHNQIAGVIIVRPHQEKSLAAVRAQLTRGLQEAQVSLRLVGRPRPAGRYGFSALFEGTFQGNPVKAWITGTASPHGAGGAWIFAAATPTVFGEALVRASGELTRSIRYVKLEVTTVMRALAGKWVGATTNTTSSHVFGRDGRYYGASESSFGGRFHNQYGDWTGSWGAGGRSNAVGRWTAHGTREQGTIVVLKSDGSTRTITYRVHREKGRTYWNEYWFNGRLHSRR